jgi:hypothetical protein
MRALNFYKIRYNSGMATFVNIARDAEVVRKCSALPSSKPLLVRGMQLHLATGTVTIHELKRELTNGFS